jgi:hypothetical protein
MRLSAQILMFAIPYAIDAASLLLTADSEAAMRRNARGQIRGRTGGSRKKALAKRFARTMGRRMRRGR